MIFLFEQLADILFNGEADIPTFFGGEVDHDEFYPADPVKSMYGENDGSGSDNFGILLFDFDGMRRRQTAMRIEVEAAIVAASASSKEESKAQAEELE